VALFRQVMQTAAVGGDQGDLSGREKAFQQQQRYEDEGDYGFCSAKAVSGQLSAFSLRISCLSK
jgi:hypothetical protein